MQKSPSNKAFLRDTGGEKPRDFYTPLLPIVTGRRGITVFSIVLELLGYFSWYMQIKIPDMEHV